MTAPAKRKHASKLGAIKLVYKKKTGALTYVQRGGNQSAVDADGVSLDSYIHALYSFAIQSKAKTALMIGCGGGVLATMLTRAGVAVTVVDIDKASFKLAKTHFGMPASVVCHVADGLAFVQKSRKRFDLLIVDAFIGETIPPQFTGDDFCHAARRALKKNGTLLMNVCLDGKNDLAADRVAARFKQNNWTVRLIDQRGPQRNAIVMTGDVKHLRRPTFLSPPRIEKGRIARILRGMHFRRWRKEEG